METNDNYIRFIQKNCKVILTFSNGNTIQYIGEVVSTDEDSMILNDRKLGEILIRKKDISQIMLKEGWQ